MKYLLKASAVTLFFFLPVAGYAQSDKGNKNLRPLADLINLKENGWDVVMDLSKDAKNEVRFLSVDSTKAKEALYHTQVTTRSPMGAVIYYSGGILVNNGWIRILGSGNDSLKRSVPEWNRGKSFKDYGEKPLFLLVADDAIGGFFAVNGGGLGSNPGHVYYFAPDNLQWQDLGISYTGFLEFCFTGNLKEFYDGSRWDTWHKDVEELHGDAVFTFTPALWSKEGADINKNIRKTASVSDLYAEYQSLVKYLDSAR